MYDRLAIFSRQTMDNGQQGLMDDRGVNVLKVKDIAANNHYFIHGYYFQFFNFFSRAIIV